MLNSKTLALTTSTALLAHEVNVTYYTTCSLNLSGLGHIAITASGTPKDGTVNTFVCNFNTTNYTEATDDVTFYGFTVPAELAAKTFIAIASYNAGAWRVVFIPSWQNSSIIDAGLIASNAVTTAKILDANVTTAKIADSNITTAKIADDNVTLQKIADIADDTILGNISGGAASPSALDAQDVRTLLDQDVTLTGDVTGTATQDFATGITTITTTIGSGTVGPTELTNTAKTDVITGICSFESGEAGYVAVKVPFACTVEEWMVNVTKAIAGTDDGTCTLYDNSGNLMTGSTITVTMSTTVGAAAPPTSAIFNSSAITANNVLTAGQSISVRTQKTTAGGRLMFTIKVKRT